MSEKKYRIREHLSQKTLVNETPTVYYTIEKRKKRYFDLFGPYEWETLTKYWGTDDYIDDIKWVDLKEVKLACERLNQNLPEIKKWTRLIEEE